MLMRSSNGLVRERPQKTEIHKSQPLKIKRTKTQLTRPKQKQNPEKNLQNSLVKKLPEQCRSLVQKEHLEMKVVQLPDTLSPSLLSGSTQTVM